MKKVLISLLLIGGFGAYAFYNNSSQAQADVQTATSGAPVSDPNATDFTTVSAPAAPATVAASTKKVAAPSMMPVSMPRHMGQYTDGTYVGSPADAYYGTIQVKATVSGGRLTNVSFLQYPNDRSTSIMINRQAMPELAQEAISAQSAHVSGVSGASDSSQAFVESLGSALAKAKA